LLLVNGQFDSVLNACQCRDYSQTKRPDTIEMNTRVDRLFHDIGRTNPYKNERDLNLARIRGEWPRNECLNYLVALTGIEPVFKP
jgi:hypothetical protein